MPVIPPLRIKHRHMAVIPGQYHPQLSGRIMRESFMEMAKTPMKLFMPYVPRQYALPSTVGVLDGTMGSNEDPLGINVTIVGGNNFILQDVCLY